MYAVCITFVCRVCGERDYLFPVSGIASGNRTEPATAAPSRTAAVLLREQRRARVTLAALTVALAAAAVLSLSLGRFGMPWPDVLRTLWGSVTGDPAVVGSQQQAVLFAVRIPRILLAVLAGAALAAAGVAYQGLFRNPLVSPDLLGVASGAGVGASLALLWSWPSVGVQALAFGSGLLAVALVLAMGSAVGRYSGGGVLVLVLAGIVISSLCSALTALVKYLAPQDDKLPEITFWLMGSLARSGSWTSVYLLAGALLVGGVPLMLLRWKLNVMTFGDDEAESVGVDTRRVRLIVIVCATLFTATAVALCGVIGWVGLVVPHLCRFLVGPNHLVLLPCSMLTGGLFLLVVDDVARTLTAGEIPLGVLTAIIGAPAFIHLLFRGRRTWAA